MMVHMMGTEVPIWLPLLIALLLWMAVWITWGWRSMGMGIHKIATTARHNKGIREMRRYAKMDARLTSGLYAPRHGRRRKEKR